MSESPSGSGERLDSWKQIASYLSHDVRTVRRWESVNGLPVHRVPGARGHSVFAYAAEIDEWLRSRTAGDVPAITADVQTIAQPMAAPLIKSWRQRHAPLAGAASVLIVGLILWRVATWPGSEELIVRLTPQAVVATSRAGAERWRHPFAASERTSLLTTVPRDPAGILTKDTPSVVVGTAHRLHLGDGRGLSGQLLAFRADGQVDHTFEFDDRLTFGRAAYEGPWALTDFSITGSGPGERVAVAAHHFEWWPSLVTILDARFQRRGTFVNAGWIEKVAWLSATRLVVAGFSNSRDAAIVALLDAEAVGGQSPEAAGSPFHCDSCGSAAPIRYVTLPRSELNRRTGSPFNRATFDVTDDGIVVHTIEVPSFADASAIDSLYEFSPTLELRSARFGDRYWDLHRTLEIQGRLRNTHEDSPEKSGPRGMQVWEPATGWRPLAVEDGHEGGLITSRKL